MAVLNSGAVGADIPGSPVRQFMSRTFDVCHNWLVTRDLMFAILGFINNHLVINVLDLTLPSP